MPSTRPFVDPATGELEYGRILAEAIPLGKLIGLFVIVSVVPFSIAAFVLGDSIFGALLTVVAQFILSVGAGIALMYVVARGMQLSRE